MQKDRRHILIELGADALADALLDLTAQSEVVENRVARMTSSGAENLERYRRGLQNIAKEDRFYTWHESSQLVEKLSSLLEDLRAANPDPRQGVEAVFQLYRMDQELFEMCDDSDGNVSYFFTQEVPEVFSRFASKCDDAEWLVDSLISLTKQDPYCVRASVFHYASDGITREGIDILVDRLWTQARNSQAEPGDSNWLGAIEAVARRSGNASLFEEARRARGDLSRFDITEIAKLYHDTGNSQKALELLNSPQGNASGSVLDQRLEQFLGMSPDMDWDLDQDDGLYEGRDQNRDRLLVDVHRALGNKEEWIQAARRIFDNHRSAETLAILVEAIGEDQRESVIDGAAETILREENLSTSDVAFLIFAGRSADAASYILGRSEQIRGEWYTTWTGLADEFMEHEHWLAATLSYRALLDSMLDRGVSKAYHHGVRYLRNLDAMAEKIEDWRGFAVHEQYLQSLRRIHGRKWSFWKQYET